MTVAYIRSKEGDGGQRKAHRQNPPSVSAKWYHSQHQHLKALFFSSTITGEAAKMTPVLAQCYRVGALITQMHVCNFSFWFVTEGHAF